MNIYIAHSSNFDYNKEIYEPIKTDKWLQKYNVILPEEKLNSNNERKFYQKLDLLIAEVSFPSTGLGIELAFAYDSSIPIYCLYKKGYTYSKAINVITSNIIEYVDTEDFLQKIKEIIESR